MALLLPLFPLQLVALPGSRIPLHIFEERYREMVGEAAATGSEFGMIRSMEGEPGGEKESGIARTGCTVTVESVIRRYPDGRFDVITRGRRRFHILSLDGDRACLQGEVEYFDDETSELVPEELADRAIAAHARLQRVIAESEETGPARDARSLSFRLADGIDDLDFRGLMLQTRSELQRLQIFVEYVPGFIARRQYEAQMKKKAPTNGSGHHGPKA